MNLFLSKEKIEPSDKVRNFLKTRQQLYINGEWVDGSQNKYYTTLNPATGEILSEVREGGAKDIQNAVLAATTAFEDSEWRGFSIEERADTLRSIADLILKNREDLAVLETLDTGKPISESYDGDILRSASNFQFFADYSKEIQDLEFKNDRETHTAFREPLGVVALVTPWNLPLYLETWKIAPALLMGNSIVLKPSELTPLTASYFTHLLHQSGILPRGVFNLVHGFGENSAGEALVSHPGVNGISFTGETSTGRAIMRSAAIEIGRASCRERVSSPV